MSDKQGIPSTFFDTVYDGTPPWETGRPQPEVVRLVERGGFRGRILDIG